MYHRRWFILEIYLNKKLVHDRMTIKSKNCVLNLLMFSFVVFFHVRMGSDVFKSSGNRCRDWWRCWQMISLRLIAIFVGDVTQNNRISIFIIVRNLSIYGMHNIVLAVNFHTSFLSHSYSVLRFPYVEVRTIRIYFRFLLQYSHRLIILAVRCHRDLGAVDRSNRA